MGVYLPFTPRLPSEYQEVEWIESTRTQRISTGYAANANMRMVLDFEITNAPGSDSQVVFGTDYGSWAWVAPLCFYYYGQGLQVGARNDTYFSGFTLNTPHTLDFSLTNVDLDGVTKTLNTTTQSNNITLFFGNGVGGYTRIYSCKIYTGNTLERDLIPCYRKLDNVIGMYDLVNNTFYTNTGSGTFTKGADLKSRKLQAAYIGEYGVPTGYTLLQYIETTATSSSNGQILQTGINLSSNYVQFDFKFRPLALRNSSNFFFASDRANLTYEYYSGYQLFNIASSSSLFKTSMSVDTDYTMNMKLNNGTMTLNNSSVSYSGSVSGHQNICFSGYYSGSAQVCSKNRRYYIKIYTGSSFDLVRDYVPVKRDLDSVAGMYDLVNNVFYTSAVNGNFVAGPEA